MTEKNEQNQKRKKHGMKNFHYGSVSLLLFFANTLIGCLNSGTTKAPERPAGIPEDAILYSYEEGVKWQKGYGWIKIDDTDIMNQYSVECYYDQTGELQEKGIFELEECSMHNRAYTAKEIKELISDFDGNYIYLNLKCDNKTLRLAKMAPKRVFGIPENAIWYRFMYDDIWVEVYDTDVKNQYYIDRYILDVSQDFWTVCHRNIYKLEECNSLNKTYTAREIKELMVGFKSNDSHIRLNLMCNEKHLSLNKITDPYER